jgi:hypothetical protein
MLVVLLGPRLLAPLVDFAHMWSMSGRPCNPGSDFKSLWQVFLRDMPMPQCPAPTDPEAAKDRGAAKSDPTPAEPKANHTRDS